MVCFRKECFFLSFMGLLLCLSQQSNAQDDQKSFLDLVGVHGEERSEILAQTLEKNFFVEGSKLIETQTWRDDVPSVATEQNKRTALKLEEIQAYLKERAKDFNESQKNIKLEHFVWQSEEKSQDEETSIYWLFGFRIGNGDKVISIISHLDTVPPGNADGWEPFSPKIEQREYLNKDTNFWVGRGTIDDKGPAVAAFSVLRAIAKTYDNEPKKLEGMTLEVIFDSSEETDMSTPHYLQDENVKKPDFGIVFDAMWIIRAEKGIERPVFTVNLGKMPSHGLWIEKLETPEQSSVNQIPDNATAIIRAKTVEVAQAFARTVIGKYLDYAFDDPTYHRAGLTVELTEDEKGKPIVKLTTKVKGAQHGSAPQENREYGANPLVSLINFLAYLANKRELRHNGYTRMSQFSAWMWGTHVFGETHSSLYAYDWLFEKGNGTTYAVTTIGLGSEEPSQQTKVKLGVDIRYALKHHSESLDDTKEGTLPGISTFATILPDLVKQFNTQVPGPKISVVTKTAIGPEFRRTDNPNLIALSQAYKETMGKSAPLISTGGGTDSKGFPKLLAAGALFENTLGPPINFHGIGEGAPLPDIYNSARIFYQLLKNTVDKEGL